MLASAIQSHRTINAVTHELITNLYQFFFKYCRMAASSVGFAFFIGAI